VPRSAEAIQPNCTDDRSDDRYNVKRDGLREYQTTNRCWVPQNSARDYPYKNAPMLGLELEVYTEDRCSVVSDLRSELLPRWKGQLILESDGSLDRRYGFEIITDPMGLTEWRECGPLLTGFLSERGVIAYQADGDYGIHLTLHRQYLSPLAEARFLMFCTAQENSQFMWAIAQRNSIYASDTDMGSFAKEVQKVRHIGGLQSAGFYGHKKIMGLGKYCPINFKAGDLAEIRIFRATLHPESFMKNIEWVYAMVEWLRAPTGSTWHYMDFIKWLGIRPQAFKDYPHLLNYLRRPEFGIRFENVRVINTWATLLPKSREELTVADDQQQQAYEKLTFVKVEKCIEESGDAVWYEFVGVVMEGKMLDADIIDCVEDPDYMIEFLFGPDLEDETVGKPVPKQTEEDEKYRELRLCVGML